MVPPFTELKLFELLVTRHVTGTTANLLLRAPPCVLGEELRPEVPILALGKQLLCVLTRHRLLSALSEASDGAPVRLLFLAGCGRRRHGGLPSDAVCRPREGQGSGRVDKQGRERTRGFVRLLRVKRAVLV
jgi:hypothetical protein